MTMINLVILLYVLGAGLMYVICDVGIEADSEHSDLFKKWFYIIIFLWPVISALTITTLIAEKVKKGKG